MFAGRYYSDEEAVDITPTVTMHQSLVGATQLGRYAYASEHDDYRIVNIGAAMIFNHMETASVTNFWTVDMDDIPDCSLVESQSYSTFPDFDFLAQLNILQGQELFANYGEDWFADRGIDLDASVGSVLVRPTKELQEIGHCLTDIDIDESDIAERGVFAARSFKAGEIVSVSPVLILPRHLLESPESNTVLINYAVSAPGSDVALFAMGKMTMANNAGDAANTELVWYDWETRTAGGHPRVLDEYSVDELEDSAFSRLDFAYMAKRDIDVGEELTLDYGAEWEQKWAQHKAAGVDASLLQPIGAPEGLFPTGWLQLKCFGKHCNKMRSYFYDEGKGAEGQNNAKASASEAEL